MKIYNSLTRKKEEFVPLESGKVGLYVCGPTVYDEPHIGHARSAYIFDCIRRYLEYKNYKVKFVRNVTDVDDKIIEKAKKVAGHQSPVTSLAEAVKEISKKYLDSYHKDMATLGILPPTKEPKATEYIKKMIKFIELLIERGAAYTAEGDVYFDIKKAKDYGKLSNQNLGKMEVGARIAPGEKKRDPLDFALWKAVKEGEPSWPSPWGPGRPGWHIECSVMSSDILGGEFDIHGGGIDLIFPHHENEIAQSEGAGNKFARYWIHNGLLTIDGEKMAKSLGNFISIKDFIAKEKDADYLKLLFLNTHYRHPVDYTKEKIDEMKAQKERFLILFDKLDRILKGHKSQGTSHRLTAGVKAIKDRFEEAMDDDFNTPLGLAALFDLVTYANKIIQTKEELTKDEAGELHAIKELILELTGLFGLKLSEAAETGGLSEKEITELVEERNKARAAKNFKRSDEIRNALSDKGVILEDAKDGTVWRKKI
ncbi:MAG: cysteine--tRNA ligase [Candidatus Omnitrophica bacterium]|nr:cysteine--tRNA ligase [Candidatus Omnitrophota bacterium]MDD5436622.1 cysteine--tRNA ligase [Candidatus Omnitrophota bacterium]